MTPPLTMSIVKEFRAAFGDRWCEDDHEGERWIFCCATMIRRGPANKRKPVDGGLRALVKNGCPIVSETMRTADGARRVSVARSTGGLLTMGGRRFDADLIEMVERAYAVSEWRMTGTVTFDRRWTIAETADRLAFAFVEGRASPVAAVAPLRRGAR